jgi:hypothetical protein
MMTIVLGAETKYPELNAESDRLESSSEYANIQKDDQQQHINAVLDEHSSETEWRRNQKEGYFPLSKNTYQYRRLQPQRTQTSFGNAALTDAGVVHRRTDGYVHSTVRGDEVKQIENSYMPGDTLQPLIPPSFIQQNMLRHGKVHNVFSPEQYEQDPFLRLQDRVKSLEFWKKPATHNKVVRRKFRAKKFLVDIPGIYEKK